jgi:hypothetical protein
LIYYYDFVHSLPAATAVDPQKHALCQCPAFGHFRSATRLDEFGFRAGTAMAGMQHQPECPVLEQPVALQDTPAKETGFHFPASSVEHLKPPMERARMRRINGLGN